MGPRTYVSRPRNGSVLSPLCIILLENHMIFMLEQPPDYSYVIHHRVTIRQNEKVDTACQSEKSLPTTNCLNNDHEKERSSTRRFPEPWSAGGDRWWLLMFIPKSQPLRAQRQMAPREQSAPTSTSNRVQNFRGESQIMSEALALGYAPRPTATARLRSRCWCRLCFHCPCFRSTHLHRTSRPESGRSGPGRLCCNRCRCPPGRCKN